ncbi:MAG: hypothetical protein ACTHXA_05260 [Gulosibacter sp.]|uniref:hypothetical protein n=1 Tax=Gulosibacter sp. TaxID=2817531 RepID=UPI003F917F3D
MSEPNSFIESSRVGVMILSIFGLVWALAAVGLSNLPLLLTVSAAVIAALLTIVLNLVAASRQFNATDETKALVGTRRRRKVFIASNIAQAVLFSVLISVCLALNQLPYLALIGSIIVGAHLIPIGISFGERPFIAGGTLLVVTGCAGILAVVFELVSESTAAGVVSLVNAAVLLILAGLQIALYGRRRAG